MLDHLILPASAPSEEGAIFVLLHGRGADNEDLAGLRDLLPASATLILPRASFHGAPWGYGGGWAWYRFLGGATPEPDSFTTSLDQLEEFLGALETLAPGVRGPLVLGGFSQGGTTSLAYALRHPGTVPYVLNFSGFLADHPDVRPGPAPGTRIFWGHGIHDPAIPFSLAQAGWRTLQDAGAQLEAREYPIGHWIAPEEIRDALAWLERGRESR